MENASYGNQLPTVMKDPRWPASGGWVRMGQTLDDVEVLYVHHTNTGEAAAFKFKDRSQ
ncbi:hypothetical protein RM550_16205 [Streptomyces sp. DSM 41527]|uniref:Uncharacterized protein n=1 Tax=Streptomyces mooreae TaxID=3075523 RepID=A0ABU2T8M4_9ACTN|nr:hypothetical protein [Streptomyces sp. DSM 41527]MDT0457265.1 hypothetical protein [Streptomyces sp. DSM 41527]